MRREKRVVRAEWEAPRRGNESIAQWQATSGAAPWGRMSGEMRPVRAKVRYSKQGVLLLPPSGRHAGMYATQGVALCYVMLPLQGVCLHPARTPLSSLLTDLQARLHAKRSGDCRKHGDDELNDFAPNGRFVSFHRVR